MPEYGGPGETLWSVNLTKGRLPPTDVSMFSLDRQHKCLMTFILRVIYILEMDNPTKKEGKKVIQIPRDFLPSARAITHAVWCKSEEASELLAAVLGTDVLVFSAITGSMINHISSPCGKALHPSPILDWGGMPCVLAVGGCNNQKQGSIQLYSLSSKSKELDLTPKTIHTKETPTYMTLHSTKTLIAVYHSTVIQVWSTRTLDKTAERDFLSPVRSIAWGVTRQSNLLVLFHRDGDQRINAPVLAEVDLYNHTYVEEPGVHGQHPLAGVPAAKIHTLPLPFAPKLLVVAYSSHRCEGLYLRSEAENNSQVANGLYQVQTPLSPSQGIRAVGIRRVDSEKDRTLHLITLYKSGLLVARSFLVKTIDLLLDKQIRLLQERRDVEVMKIKSAGTSLESIKLRTTVPANQVAFLEQTHHNCKYPPVVFFEVLVKQGDQMPEVSVNGNCIRNDHELSLDDNLLEKISSAMQSAVLKAVRTGCGAWLPCMIDACYSQLKSFGNLQPSQLKGLRTKSNPISFDKRPGHGLRNTFTPGSTFTASAGDTKFSAGSYSHSGSVTTQTNQVTGGTPPNSFGERSGEYLQLTQSPQLCYRRAFVIQPRVCSGVFSPDGSLIVYNIPQNSLYSNVELLQGFTEPPEITNWKLDGTREAVLHNIQHSTDAEASLSWKLLLPMLSCPQSRSVALSSVVGSILSSLASNKRHFLAAAIACCCISASRSQVPLSFTPLATCSPPVVVCGFISFAGILVK